MQVGKIPVAPQLEMAPRIVRLSLPEGRRILAVSDVHGNLPYLRGLLDKAHFCETDILILVGNLLEKGPESLATLRFVMALAKTHTVYALTGNWDWWVPTLEASDRDEELLWYLNNRPNCTLGQMCRELGIATSPETDIAAARAAVTAQFRAECDFLRAMPDILETEHYIFVHGGLPEGDPSAWNAWQCLKHDNFMATQRRFPKWVVVGHWPVMLYRESVVNANPVFDREKKIISIDGGCVLKDDGQLNALVIPCAGSEDFDFVAYDPFPTSTVLTPQAEGGRSCYIRWGDNRVRVLRRGAEFSRVRHIRTGYELDVLTKYLYGDGEECAVNDCSDYVLPLRPGDTVSVVERTSRGFYVKHEGVSGWYFGALDEGDTHGNN